MALQADTRGRVSLQEEERADVGIGPYKCGKTSNIPERHAGRSLRKFVSVGLGGKGSAVVLGGECGNSAVSIVSIAEDAVSGVGRLSPL